MTPASSPARLAGASPVTGIAGLAIGGMSKSFGPNLAVRDVELEVEPGAFLGLVGPNGAGKTTPPSMAVGLLRPDQGNAWVAGIRLAGGRGRPGQQLLGVLPDGLALPRQLTGRELLTYLGRLRSMLAVVVAARVDELMSALDLEAAEATLIGDGFIGMRKKIGLAAALLHGPRLLVLDEPFEAVDRSRPRSCAPSSTASPRRAAPC